ncbi:PHD and RING finger domain-containing protein 1-like [Dorcoceras hygrometricum]|uniref:PHD and RING finger domain-containing protein 1-like n=1 Tax=Dorcoceras hygrometricum TaxID=472368 RepID=A0A2Z7DDT9_9LAMI|nr:PHD and RING finger domain-containing protein 1-like [Dorcoceras hygrometricum]
MLLNWEALLKEKIPDDIGNFGAVGGSGMEATRADDWMASSGPHPKDSFVHWSGGPATKTIESGRLTIPPTSSRRLIQLQRAEIWWKNSKVPTPCRSC